MIGGGRRVVEQISSLLYSLTNLLISTLLLSWYFALDRKRAKLDGKSKDSTRLRLLTSHGLVLSPRATSREKTKRIQIVKMEQNKERNGEGREGSFSRCLQH